MAKLIFDLAMFFSFVLDRGFLHDPHAGKEKVYPVATRFRWGVRAVSRFGKRALTLHAFPIGVGWPLLHCTVWNWMSERYLAIHLFIRYGWKMGRSVPLRPTAFLRGGR
ncbi:hypothetical protein ACPJHQ_14000 [Rossellomorea sp. H39__3]